MKNKILFILIFLLNSSLYSQNEGYAIYKVKTLEKNKEISTDNLDQKLITAIENSGKELENLKFKLLFNSNYSLYQEIEMLDNDANDNVSKKLSKIFSGYSGWVYSNSKRNNIVEVKEIFGKKYFVESKINDFQWKIINKNEIVNGYNCNVATTKVKEEGRNGIKEITVTAWFTNDLNLPFGPNGFSGLPGLIIQIQKGNIITYLTEIKFEKNKENIEFPNYNTISLIEFNRIMKDIILNKRNFINEN